MVLAVFFCDRDMNFLSASVISSSASNMV